MRERPILFRGPMVRALLAGRKTQTRRVVKTRPENQTRVGPVSSQAHIASPEALAKCPYGVPGDRLWVKETWCKADTAIGFDYAADRDWRSDQRGMGWRASIHMPRAASRLTLRITDVRVERLRSISAADAEAEGVREPSLGEIHVIDRGAFGQINRERADPLLLWELLWRSINGEASWRANPWVWAIGFEVET